MSNKLVSGFVIIAITLFSVLVIQESVLEGFSLKELITGGGASKTNIGSNEDNAKVPTEAIAQLKGTALAFSSVAEQVLPAVVNISTEKTIKQNQSDYSSGQFKDLFGDEFFRRFFQNPRQRDYKQKSLGSGVIIDKRGYILTNNHVIDGADVIKVLLSDKREFTGKVVGVDPKTDLAVIKIDVKGDLPFVELGDSDEIKVGEWAIAIGNPFGLNQTVTVGIISAKGRANVGIADYEDFIQTDAAINPGNSGGALLNIDGELIGINTAIFSRNGGYQGISFAIPSNMAKRVFDELLSKGKITRGWLGITIQDLDENLAKQFKLKDAGGVLIGGFLQDSPAKSAGIQAGDVIIAYNGKSITDANELRNAVAQTIPGTKVKIKLIRDGKELSVMAKVTEMPDKVTEEENGKDLSETSDALGIYGKELTTDLASELGYTGDYGVVIMNIKQGGSAEYAGLQNGDLIKEINRGKVKTLAEYQKAVKTLKRGDRVLLLIRRGDFTQYVVVELVK